jgi:hypothetical protein
VFNSHVSDLLHDQLLTAPLNATLGPLALSTVRHEGFAVIQSEPADLTTEGIAERSRALHEFGAALGTPVFQSPRRELVEDVKDYSDIETTDDRGYRSGGELLPHSDPPTLIILHCLQKAKEGGHSILVRVQTIVDQMMTVDPKLVDELFGLFPDWRVAGQYGITDAGPSSDLRPVLQRHNGILSCVLYRPFIEKAALALGTPLSEEQVAALDLFEACSLDDRLAITFMLEPGQTLVLHNRSVLHARTNFVDWPELDRRRHLLRMWIDAPRALPVHPSHELGDFFMPR